MDEELLKKTLREAARGAGRRLRQVYFGTQAPDHPILWGVDESYYLKFFIFQVIKER
jgi:23S rRNA (cytosine1962-C5)-methyltransferase